MCWEYLKLEFQSPEERRSIQRPTRCQYDNKVRKMVFSYNNLNNIWHQIFQIMSIAITIQNNFSKLNLNMLQIF